MPGPLLTFATFLGAAQTVTSPLLGALLMVRALPFWSALSARPAARNALAGLNAGLVNLLLAALYNPVSTSVTRSLPVAFRDRVIWRWRCWLTPP